MDLTDFTDERCSHPLSSSRTERSQSAEIRDPAPLNVELANC